MMSRNADNLCFLASIHSVTPAELIRKRHVTVAEKKKKKNHAVNQSIREQDFASFHCHEKGIFLMV